MSAEPAKRIAVIVVPGVGDHPAGEAVTQVATALTTDAEGYRWAEDGDPGPLTVEVPSDGARRGERHDAQRRRLTLGPGTRIDLIEMRWSDLSSFPGSGLRAFFGAAFGLALQIATVGLEATPRRSGWRMLANRTMALASWWVGAVIVPVTLMAALAGTMLWLAVDEPLGISDWMAVVAVLAAGVPAALALGAGLEDGGWGFTDWRRFLGARWTSRAFVVAAIVVGVWRGREAGSVEGGLGQTVLAFGGYGVRPAWVVGAALIAVALLVLLVHHSLYRDGGALQRSFTSLATTTLSPLLVAVLGTILIGGIGAVAFRSAEDATWGEPAPALRCLTASDDREWGRDCGTDPRHWPALSESIPRRLDDAGELDARASLLRRGIVRNGSNAALPVVDAMTAEATRIREAAEKSEDDAGTAPTTWAADVLEASMLPLVPVVISLVALLAVVGLGLLVIVPLAMRIRRGGVANPPGTRLDLLLRSLAGRAGTTVVAIAGLVGCVMTIAFFTVTDPRDPPGWLEAGWIHDRLPSWIVDLPPGFWAIPGTLILGGLVLARALPVDPRKYKEDVGGALKRLRTFLDIPYDVATYLRIDRGDGIRSRIVSRYRAVLGRVQDEDPTHIVFVAHSQGSMYTLATLFGDPCRQNPVLSWQEWSDAPAGRLATPVGVLTFGCPVRQTYEERLPGQYGWTDHASRDLGSRIGAISGPWFNAYRPRDYIGRAVFHQPGEPGTNAQGTYLAEDVPSPAGPIHVVDACIRGSGSHTGYFGDPHLIGWLDALVRSVVTGTPVHPGDYEPGSAATDAV